MWTTRLPQPMKPPPLPNDPKYYEWLAKKEAMSFAANSRIAKTPEELVALAEQVRTYLRGE